MNISKEIANCFEKLPDSLETPPSAELVSTRYKVKLPNNLSFFEGHFPSGAILPAVGIMDLSLLLYRNCVETSPVVPQTATTKTQLEFASWPELGVKKINQLKVKAPIFPLETYEVHFTKKPNASNIEVSWITQKDQSLCAELKIEIANTP